MINDSLNFILYKLDFETRGINISNKDMELLKYQLVAAPNIVVYSQLLWVRCYDNRVCWYFWHDSKEKDRFFQDIKSLYLRYDIVEHKIIDRNGEEYYCYFSQESYFIKRKNF